METTPLYLKKGQDRRLRSGHCWVFSNEVDIAKTPLQSLAPGQPVDVLDSHGKWFGSGYANPHSLICARLVSRDPAHPLSASLLVHRLKVASALRERLHDKPFYRLVFGESDGLPGLVVDRYGEHLVVQITTAGMERMRDDIIDGLARVIRPKSVLFRNDGGIRQLEGLPSYVDEALGGVPDRVILEEGGLRFRVSLRQGQKTGWFFDQADNRARMRRYFGFERVLDVCSYIGAWGIQAAGSNQGRVLCLDQSRFALDELVENARLNGLEQRIERMEGDAFESLGSLRADRERFDLVILDPPAFIKRKRDMKEGIQAYRRLNQLAMQLLSRDGLLITSSCSFHMSGDSLLEIVHGAARHLDRSLQLIETGHQAVDHPIHPGMPETSYLKTLFLRVLPRF